jgi:hypothetical protein
LPDGGALVKPFPAKAIPKPAEAEDLKKSRRESFFPLLVFLKSDILPFL